MPGDDEFRHESMESRDTVVRYLNSLIDGLTQGSVEFGNGSGGLVLEPRGLIELDVRAKRKGKRCKINFKLEWREDAGVVNGGNHPLFIRPTGSESPSKKGPDKKK